MTDKKREKLVEENGSAYARWRKALAAKISAIHEENEAFAEHNRAAFALDTYDEELARAKGKT